MKKFTKENAVALMDKANALFETNMWMAATLTVSGAVMLYNHNPQDDDSGCLGTGTKSGIHLLAGKYELPEGTSLGDTVLHPHIPLPSPVCACVFETKCVKCGAIKA